MDVVVNGRAIEHYKDLDVRETALVDGRAEPSYYPAIENGAGPYDFIVDANLVMYLPLHLLKGTTIKSLDRYLTSCAITGATWSPTGREFDGDDEIDLTNLQPMPTTGEIQVWAYMANWADGANRNIFDTSDVGGDNRILIRKSSNNKMLFYVVQGASEQVVITSAAQSGSGWKHFAMAFTNNSTQAYIDLTQVGTDTSCTIPTFTTESVAIGNVVDGANAYFNGYIDNFILYSRKLATAERAHNYNVTIRRTQ